MTRSARYWAVGLLAAALGGCQLAPDHPPPVTPSPPAWREGAAASTWPAADWWRGFQSSELDQLLADAKAHNDDIKAAEARIQEADAQARIAGAALLPTVSLSAGGQAVRTVNPLGKERHNVNGAGVVGASYEIDFWGKNRAAATSAKDAAKSAQYDAEVVRMTILTAVANTYFQARSLQDQVRIAQAQTDLARANLAAMQAKFHQGLVDAQSVSALESQVAALQATSDPLAQQLTHVRDALAILTGRSPESLTLDQSPIEAIATPGIGAGLPSALLLHRPDVQRAEATLAAANANITVARASALPSINLTLAGGVESMALAAATSAPPQTLYNLALGLTQPLFDGGRLRGQIDYSRAHYGELFADYSKTAHQAFADVEDALSAVSASATTEADDQRSLDKAQQSYAMAKAGFDAGAVDLMTEQSAQATIYPAQTAFDQARLAHLESLVALYQAMGGGWSLPK